MSILMPAGVTEGLRRFRPYPKYKDSGVAWLEKIPEHWNVRKIKRLCLVRRGASPRPIDDPIYFDDSGEYAWVRIADVTASERYLEKTTQRLSEVGKSKSVPLEPGELFVSIAATVGKPIITKIKCCIHDGFVYFVNLRENREYLYYLLSCGEAYKGLGKLGTQLNLNTDTIGDIYIPIPPSLEQQGVTAFLDRETVKIDALVAKKERLIELLREKRAAFITKAVTQGLDPSVPMKDAAVEWLDKYPTHWTGLPLKRWVGTKITDGPHETPELVAQGVDFISAEAVAGGRIDFDKRRGFISPALHAQYCRKCRPVRDDILICKSGATTGKLARVDVDFEFSVWSPLALVRSDRSRMLPRFLEMGLGSEYVQKQIQRTWSAGTQPNISMGDLERLFIVAPKIEEQAKILDFIDQETGGFDTLCQRIRDGIDALKEFRVALISAAVGGKIDVREEVT
jgi:type I restriction enzyme S subunit